LPEVNFKNLAYAFIIAVSSVELFPPAKHVGRIVHDRIFGPPPNSYVPMPISVAPSADVHVDVTSAAGDSRCKHYEQLLARRFTGVTTPPYVGKLEIEVRAEIKGDEDCHFTIRKGPR